MNNNGTDGGRGQNNNGFLRGVIIALAVCVLFAIFAFFFVKRKPADEERADAAAEVQEETAASGDDQKTETLPPLTGSSKEKNYRGRY